MSQHCPEVRGGMAVTCYHLDCPFVRRASFTTLKVVHAYFGQQQSLAGDHCRRQAHYAGRGGRARQQPRT